MSIPVTYDTSPRQSAIPREDPLPARDGAAARKTTAARPMGMRSMRPLLSASALGEGIRARRCPVSRGASEAEERRRRLVGLVAGRLLVFLRHVVPVLV